MGKVSQLHWDLQRADSFRPPNSQLYAVSKLIGYLEGQLLEGGFKDPKVEMEIRVRVAETISAFGIQHHESPEFEAKLAAVRGTMREHL